MSRQKRILAIRNDKLGDFMLAWPALAALKSAHQESTIIALVPEYTRDMAELCPWIDEIIIDEHRESTLSDAVRLSRLFKTSNIDAAVLFFSEFRTTLALWLAHIPVRVGPATKLAQIFLNDRLRQRRSLSLKPEFEYNIDVSNHYSNSDKPYIIHRPILEFNKDALSALRVNYETKCNISKHRRIAIIHPGTGGSATNLTPHQYAELALALANIRDIHFVITAGPQEEDIARQLAHEISNIDHSVYVSESGLVAFSQFIACCDLFISGSTGPLHIAGALDIPTAAFYPARKSATALRWKTLNSEHKALAFSPKKNINDDDMKNIDIQQCANKIAEKLLVEPDIDN